MKLLRLLFCFSDKKQNLIFTVIMSELLAAYLVTCIRVRDMWLCYAVLKCGSDQKETQTFIKKKLSRGEMRAELCKIFIAFYYRAYQPFLNPRLYSGLCVCL